MRPLVYIVTLVEFAIVAILVVVEGIVARLQMGRRERRRVELATVRAERTSSDCERRIRLDGGRSSIARSDRKPTSSIFSSHIVAVLTTASTATTKLAW